MGQAGVVEEEDEGAEGPKRVAEERLVGGGGAVLLGLIGGTQAPGGGEGGLRSVRGVAVWGHGNTAEFG